MPRSRNTPGQWRAPASCAALVLLALLPATFAQQASMASTTAAPGTVTTTAALNETALQATSVAVGKILSHALAIASADIAAEAAHQAGTSPAPAPATTPSKPSTSPSPSTIAGMPAGVNPVDTPNLYALLNGTVDSVTNSTLADSDVVRAAVDAALNMQQAAGFTSVNTTLLERAATLIVNIRRLPYTLGTGSNIKLILARVAEIRKARDDLKALIPTDQWNAIIKLEVEAIRLYVGFINTYPIAYITLESRNWLVVRDVFRVLRDTFGAVAAGINLIVLVRTTPLPTRIPLPIGGSIIFTPLSARKLMQDAGVNVTDLSAEYDPVAADAPAEAASTSVPVEIIPEDTTTAYGVMRNQTQTLIAAIGEVLNFTDRLDTALNFISANISTILDPTAFKEMSMIATAGGNSSIGTGALLQGLANAAASASSLLTTGNATIGSGVFRNAITDLLTGATDSTATTNVFDWSNGPLSNALSLGGLLPASIGSGGNVAAAADAVTSSDTYKALLDAMPNLQTILSPDFLDGFNALNLPFGNNNGLFGNLANLRPCSNPIYPPWNCNGTGPIWNITVPAIPAADPNVTNGIRIAVAILVVIQNVFNLVQSVAELVSDALAVIPPAVALYTGSINYGLSLFAYYQLLQTTGPALERQWWARWNRILTNLANNLQASSTRSPRAQLRAARAQLQSSLQNLRLINQLGTSRTTLVGK